MSRERAAIMLHLEYTGGVFQSLPPLPPTNIFLCVTLQDVNSFCLDFWLLAHRGRRPAGQNSCARAGVVQGALRNRGTGRRSRGPTCGRGASAGEPAASCSCALAAYPPPIFYVLGRASIVSRFGYFHPTAGGRRGACRVALIRTVTVRNPAACFA